MLVPLALVLACSTGGPAARGVAAVRVLAVEESRGRLQVEWALVDDVGNEAVSESGEVSLSLVERSVQAAPRPDDPVVCRAAAPVVPTDFRAGAGGTVLTTFLPRPSCPPPPASPDRWRALRLVYSSGTVSVAIEVDPPDSMRTPTTAAGAAEKLASFTASQAAGDPGVRADEVARTRGAVQSWVSSWGALVPLVPDFEPPPSDCTETGGPLPLVEFDDLLSAAGQPAAPLEKRLTSPGLLGRLSGAEGPLGDGEVLAHGASLDQGADRIWVRRVLSRTEATPSLPKAVPPTAFVPGEFSGVLALMGRLPPRLLCAIPLRATSSPGAAAVTTQGLGEAQVESELARDLDRVAFDVTHTARRDLTRSELPFFDTHVKVTASVPPDEDVAR